MKAPSTKLLVSAGVVGFAVVAAITGASSTASPLPAWPRWRTVTEAGMSRFRVGLAVVAMTITALAFSGVANAAPIPGGDITAVCAGTTNGTTFTLTADCGEVTTPLTVPAAITTVDGGGHTISATDLNGADPTVHTPIPQFDGGIVTNVGAGQTMNIQNVTITGPAAGFSLCNNSNNVLYGIFFNGAAGGSVTNVTVDHIFQFQNGAFGSCQTGRAIRADNSGTVTITNTVVKDYQKSGFEARGSTIMNVSGSTAGPPHPLEGLISQNGVSIVGAAGTVANNTIFGSGNAQAGVGGNGAGTAVLLSGAHDVTVTNNTLTSPAAPRPGTDIGISVSAGSSTGIVISFNKVNRLGPDVPDSSGLGIDVFTPDGSMATLICNTFSNWKTNVVGAEQISCAPLPNGSECQAYSAPAPPVDSGKNYQQTAPNPIIGATPFTWTVGSGTLPPGLSLSSAGAITGTPTAAGTFNFTMKLVDSTGLTATQAQTITIAPDCAPPPVVTPPAGANRDAFCWGTGPNSYGWFTPTEVGTFDWKTLYVAFVVKGVDLTGVMHNGFTPYCGTGTLTGVVVDNQGEIVTQGYPDAIQNWGGPNFLTNPTWINPNKKGAIPEWYEEVTP